LDEFCVAAQQSVSGRVGVCAIYKYFSGFKFFLILKELSIETFETPFGRLARRFVAHPYDSMLGKKSIP